MGNARDSGATIPSRQFACSRSIRDESHRSSRVHGEVGAILLGACPTCGYRLRDKHSFEQSGGREPVHISCPFEFLEDCLISLAVCLNQCCSDDGERPGLACITGRSKNSAGNFKCSHNEAATCRPRFPPRICELKARASRVIESIKMNTCSPASTSRLARSIASNAIRV